MQNWSLSKYNEFITCKKKYYLNYIIEPADFENDNLLFSLKKLNNRFLIRNKVLRNVIKMKLEDAKFGFEEEDCHYLNFMMKNLNEILNNKNISFETYYNIKFDTINFIAESEYMLKTFFKSGVFAFIKNIDTDSWDAELDYDNTFKIGDYYISASPDFLLKSKEICNFYFWKTGSKKIENEFEEKIKAYSVYKNFEEYFVFHKKENIKFYFFYLKDNLIAEYVLEKINISECSEFIKNKILEMQFWGQEEMRNFSGNPEICKFCRYQLYCGGE